MFTRAPTIEKGIPLPSRKGSSAPRRILTSMEIGDSEIKRRQKPTAPMLQALEYLASGGELGRSRFRESYFITTAQTEHVNIRSSLFYGLRERELIQQTSRDKYLYRITRHGHDVNAKLNDKPERKL